MATAQTAANKTSPPASQFGGMIQKDSLGWWYESIAGGKRFYLVDDVPNHVAQTGDQAKDVLTGDMYNCSDGANGTWELLSAQS